jgi:hypothetical protein
MTTTIRSGVHSATDSERPPMVSTSVRSKPRPESSTRWPGGPEVGAMRRMTGAAVRGRSVSEGGAGRVGGAGRRGRFSCAAAVAATDSATTVAASVGPKRRIIIASSRRIRHTSARGLATVAQV